MSILASDIRTSGETTEIVKNNSLTAHYLLRRHKTSVNVHSNRYRSAILDCNSNTIIYVGGLPVHEITIPA